MQEPHYLIQIYNIISGNDKLVVDIYLLNMINVAHTQFKINFDIIYPRDI